MRFEETNNGIDIARLKSCASLLSQRLSRSQNTSENMISILGSFDERLSVLETAMRPTQIRTYAYRRTHKNIDSTLKHAEEILAKFDVSRQVEQRIKEGPKGDLEGYLKAVDRLNEVVAFFSQNRQFKSSDSALQHAKDLFRECLVRLEEDFRTLITANSKPIETEKLMSALTETPQPATTDAVKDSGEDDDEDDDEKVSSRSGKVNITLQTSSLPQPMSPQVIARLHAVAGRLVSGGYASQCVACYREVRVRMVESSLRRIGVEKLKSEDVLKMTWEELEGKISGWIKQLKVAVLVFLVERQLCDSIFKGLEPQQERTFAEVAESGAAMIFTFGEAVVRSKKSPEKLFVLLDMYETLRDVMPQADAVFDSEECKEIRETAHVLLKRLAQTARETLSEFEELVEKDVSKAPVADGAVHPLTSYVINYIKFLFEYHATLQELYEKEDRLSNTAADSAGSEEKLLAAATARIMSVLLANIENKAKQYKDPSLTQLFLMNNVHYMVRSVRKSEAREMLGDDWVQRHRRIVQQHAKEYQRSAWGKVLACLSPIGQSSTSGPLEVANVNKNTVKERFRQFNLLFEEVHSRQVSWTIPDNELRSAVQLQVAEVLVPAYRSFIKRYRSILEQGSTFGKTPNPSKYIKYSPESLDPLLEELFVGKPRAQGKLP